MTDSPARINPPTMPAAMNGSIYQQVGKYARGAVLYAFERLGGPEALADWASDPANTADFYTRLFPKIIARESEVTHVKSMDDLMDVIDGDYHVESVEEQVEVVRTPLQWTSADPRAADLVDFPDDV